MAPLLPDDGVQVECHADAWGAAGIDPDSME